jgi:hypothetical protein
VPADITTDGHGHVIVAGTLDTFGDPQYLTLAYKVSDGTLAWASKYNGSAVGSNSAAAVAADPGNSQIYVTGVSFGLNFNELTTIAYAAATGTQLWVKHDTGNHDIAKSVVVDTTNHNVYAVAETEASPEEFNTFAYSATGTQLWNKIYVSPVGNNAVPDRATVDPGNGQVYVVGGQRTPTNTEQTILVAYSSAGTQLWTHIEHAGNDDIAWGIAVDSANHNVYIAADKNDSSGGQQEFVTFADNALGQRVWQVSHQSTANPVGVSGPEAIAVDSTRAQVYVTGGQSNGNGNSDGVTIAYTA